MTGAARLAALNADTFVEAGAMRGCLSPFDFDLADAAYDDRRLAVDVALIADRNGIPERVVARAKDHLFNNDHILDEGIGKCDAMPEIANAWHRLQDGAATAADRRLIDHEYFESRFEAIFGTDYRTAHEATVRSGRGWEPDPETIKTVTAALETLQAN